MCVAVSVGVLAASLSLGTCPREALHIVPSAGPLLLAPTNKSQAKPYSSSAKTSPIVRSGLSRKSKVHSINNKSPSLVVLTTSTANKNTPEQGFRDLNHQGQKSKKENEGSIDTFGETIKIMNSSLELGNAKSAVSVAEVYLKRLNVDVGAYYRILAPDRLTSEQADAWANLVPDLGFFANAEQAIANLKVLRQGVEQELSIDETDAKSARADDTGRKNAERARLGRRIVSSIGTDEDLENALRNIKEIQSKPPVVKMLSDAIEQQSEINFRAVQEKSNKVGVYRLTREDIDTLTHEQIKQLRGY
jgi:hypothetical protein